MTGSTQSSAVTIFSFPNQLLVAIAIAGQEDRVADLYRSNYKPPRNLQNRSRPRVFKSEWTLSHVSHRFREVIVEAPALWTLPEVSCTNEGSPKFFKLYLQRSRAYKISATLRGFPDRDSDDTNLGVVLTQVIENVNRTQTLRIEFTMEGQAETFDHFRELAAPHLQRLEIIHVIEDDEWEGEEATVSMFSSTPRLRSCWSNK
ncbi:hypothetical protein B0H12DRAFT_1133251 [Mycena haematopus]|nr:hypothetical protein B0H12DRAFT_1133251 [Mycena haematopus]